MSAQTGNLTRCPVCHSDLEAADRTCKWCGYDEIEDADFLNESDQAGYRQRLDDYREAWIGFENSLREQLRKFGTDWRELENWREIWTQVRAGATEIKRDWRATFKHAEYIRKQLEDESKQVGEKKREDEPPPPPPLPPSPKVEPENLERVRQWVANLPDGEVDMGAWVEFLDSFDETVDAFFLEAFRDEELKRQFNDFDTVTIDPNGNLSSGRRRKVKQFVEKLGDGVELVMLKIPGGEFQMGAEKYSFEQPVHTVNVPDFYLGKHPVTQAQWKAVASLPRISIEIGDDDSYFKGEDLPVECVSWAEAEEFCARLSKKTGRRYRVPSEAEWEYACRAGSRSPFTFGPTLTPSVANYDGDRPYGNAPHGIFRGQTVVSGSLCVANRFGLCDMHGNVCEWCADEWHDTYAGAPTNGSVWISSDSPAYRVVRGGSWTHAAEVSRSSDRNRERPDVSVKLYYMGIRVALDL
jgi:formylglycine-generating enzyme required for sulfatase activity